MGVAGQTEGIGVSRPCAPGAQGKLKGSPPIQPDAEKCTSPKRASFNPIRLEVEGKFALHDARRDEVSA